jgi:lysozyme family protein
MSLASFQRCNAIFWLTQNDGQQLHVTTGGPGGATSWGVIFSPYAAWQVHHGALYPTLATGMSNPKLRARTLQRAGGAMQDGLIGDDTVRAAAAMDPATLIRRFSGSYEAHERPADGARIARGWDRRIEADSDPALSWLAAASAPARPARCAGNPGKPAQKAGPLG